MSVLHAIRWAIEAWAENISNQRFITVGWSLGCWVLKMVPQRSKRRRIWNGKKKTLIDKIANCVLPFSIRLVSVSFLSGVSFWSLSCFRFVSDRYKAKVLTRTGKNRNWSIFVNGGILPIYDTLPLWREERWLNVQQCDHEIEFIPCHLCALGS